MLSDLSSAPEALLLTLRVAGVGLAISSAELLSTPDLFRPGGLLADRVPLSRRAWMLRPRVAQALRAAVGGLASRGWLAARLVAGLVMLAAPLALSSLRWAVFLAALATLILRVRTPHATHASGSMSVVILVAATAALAAGTTLSAEIALWFIAGQAWLAYFTAGASKLPNRPWRDGQAITLIMSTTMWGSRRGLAWLRRHPRVSWAACWMTMLGECSIPLTLLLPLPLCLTLLAIALAFHVITAVVMGLNTFVLLFPATYPAILFCWYAVHGHG